MQKILAYLVLLLLPLATRGQALSEWYYWFDTDTVPQKSGQVSDQKFRLEADVSNLSTGAHTLFVQVADTAGVYSPPLGTWFYYVPDTKDIDKLFFWVDNENVMHTTDFGDGKFDIDVTGIPTGFHSINLQVMDKKGWVSAVNTYLFYKVPASAKVEKLRYWIDGTQDTKEEAYGQGSFLIDVSECTPGFHFIYYYVVDAAGNSSKIQSAGFYRMPIDARQKLYYWFAGDTQATEVKDFANGFVADVTRVQEGFNTIYTQIVDQVPTNIEANHFIKIPQTENGGDMTLVCIIDGKVVGEEKVAAHGGVVKCDMDVSNMEVGLHKAMFQLITPTGIGSSIAESYFIRTLTNEDVATMQCTYTIDGFRHYVHKGTCADGVFHFDLPVEDVEDGLHRIDYMLVAENGATTTQGSAWFFMTPLGGNAITQYDYWLNDKNDEVQSVTLENPVDPFQLVKLLPVTSEPIRSSCFHFEVKDGKPMMYAKNDIHFRFHDKSGRWVDGDNQYVDYNVPAEVTDIAELQSTQTFERPEENGIKWFKFEAERGDSIALKSSLATTMEIFGEEGKCLYSVSGSNSVAIGGAHVPANGIYYVAVHDVTGTKNNQITLQSYHLGKFDLLSTSNPTFGILPCVQILEVDGNGFDNLKSVVFRKGDREIRADSIASSDKSRARLYFLFNGDEPQGKYDLVLNFDDGEDVRTITRKDYITLSEAALEDIEIAIINQRAVADPYPVHITVTNHSNVCYQAIPFYFAIDHIDRMTSIRYMNFGVGCSRELYENGLQLSFEYDSFNGNNSRTRVVPTVIPELLPGESKTFTIGVKTGNHQVFNVYSWTGTPWNLLAPETSKFINDNYSDIMARRAKKRAPGIAGIFDGCEDDPCSLAGPISFPAECACGMSLALGGTLGGIQNALQNQHNRAMRDQLAQSGLFDDPYEYFPDQYLPSPEDLMWYWLQHCLPGKAGQAASAFNTGRQMLGNNPCQDPPPHPVDPYNPGDPNEMHGTVSEAGSKYLKQELLDISYSIEFENDPKIANASAHRIVVRDTLDSKVFDFDSFKPTGVKIGEKVLELDGIKNSTKTIDMRPEINAIAEVNVEFNPNTGVAQWTLSSLDPMTMEETYDIMQGILPVNNGGNGVGYLNYDVSLKKPLKDGQMFSNRASIVFDFEDPILTPTWTNIVDAVCPSSRVCDLEMVSDTTVRVAFEGYDERSGVWKYELYVQHGENAPWWKEAEMDSASYDFRFYEDIDYGFCVVATDSAGNVEKKVIERERGFHVYTPEYEDGIEPIHNSETIIQDGEENGYDLSGRKVGRKAEGIVIRNKKKTLTGKK